MRLARDPGQWALESMWWSVLGRQAKACSYLLRSELGFSPSLLRMARRPCVLGLLLCKRDSPDNPAKGFNGKGAERKRNSCIDKHTAVCGKGAASRRSRSSNKLTEGYEG